MTQLELQTPDPVSEAASEIVHLGYEDDSKTFCGLDMNEAEWWSAPYGDATAAGEQDCVVCADLDALLEAER